MVGFELEQGPEKSKPSGAGDGLPSERLPRRDYVLLPLTAILTVTLLFLCVEVGARLIWPEQKRDMCEIWEAGHSHMRPNCQTRVKLAEGAWVDYRYNECGYRSGASCGPKPANALRVVVLGTSVTRGFWVSYEDTYSGRLERSFGRQCQRPVEFHNLSIGGAIGPVWHTVVEKAEEAIHLEPDALVLLVTSFDLQQYSSTTRASTEDMPSGAPISLTKMIAGIRQLLDNTRAITLAMHLVFSDASRYVPLFLMHGDSADYMRPPLSPEWQFRLGIADTTIDSLSKTAQATGVHLIVLYSPSRQEVLIAHMAKRIPAVDPRTFGRALANIAQRHGATFVTPIDLEAAAPDPNALFYAVDGHPTGDGHRLIAEALERGLNSQVPEFRDCAGYSTRPEPAENGQLGPIPNSSLPAVSGQ